MTINEKDLEIIAFVFGVYCGCTEGRYPVSEDEMRYTIGAWKQEGVELPEGLTAKKFCKHWNAICKEDGIE